MQNRLWSSSLKRALVPSLSLAVAMTAFAGSANAASCLVDGRSPVANTGGTWPTGITSAISGAGCAGATDVVMAGRVFVAGGGTVEILSGTVVRGMTRTHAPDDGGAPPTLSALGAPGALIVTRGGQIESDGDPTAPVIMTTAAMDNNGDGVPDDLNGDGFLDAFPGFGGACTCADQPGAGLPAPFGTVACTGPDELLGTGDDTLGTCTLNDGGETIIWPGGAPGGNGMAPVFYDDTPATNPLAPINPVTGAENVSLWGGLVVLGTSPLNLGAVGVGPQQGIIEGITVPGEPIEFATCGGANALDSSGFIEYTSVRHAGDELGEGNELNGITLCGVGAGTRVEYSEVYANFDDGLEIFGGTVSTNNINVNFAGDDQFDLDQGHIGAHQFWFGIMPFFNEYADGSSWGSASGDKIGEWDGDDFDESGGAANVTTCGRLGDSSIATTLGLAPCPMQSVSVYNLTGISNDLTRIGIPGAYVAPEYDPEATECDGDPTTVTPGEPGCCNVAGPPAAEECTASDNEGVEMRNGFAGELRNSVVINTGSRQPFDVVPNGGPTAIPAFSGSGAPGYQTDQNICSFDGADDGLQGPNPVGFGELIRVISSTFADGAALPGAPNAGAGPCVGDESDAIVNGDEYAQQVLGQTSIRQSCVDDGSTNGADSYIDGTSPPGLWPGLINEDTTFDPQGFGAGTAGATGKLLDAAGVTSVKATAITPAVRSWHRSLQHHG